MTEERYTLEEAAILLNRQTCEREGHQIERIKASGWVADEKDHYRCGRCDVWIEFTYPQPETDGSPHARSVILTSLDVEPSFTCVGFPVGDGLPVRVFASMTHWSHVERREIRTWVEANVEPPMPILAWPEVVALAKGAQIRAWNDGEWVQGKAKP